MVGRDGRDADRVGRALPASRTGRGDLGRPRDARDGGARSRGRAAGGARRHRFRPSRTTTRCCCRCTTGSSSPSSSRPGSRGAPQASRTIPDRGASSRTCSRTRGSVRARVPAAEWARPGYFAYDTMTLIGPGTWEAARGAVDAALTAADLVAAGAPHAYALCRPPGHHVCRAALRRLVLPEQRRDRSRGASPSRGPGRRPRRRRAPRERDAGDLLGPATTSASRRSTSIRPPAGSRISSGFADETTRLEPQPAAPARNRRRRLAQRRRPRQPSGSTPRRSSSRSAWMRPPPIPRARCA